MTSENMCDFTNTASGKFSFTSLFDLCDISGNYQCVMSDGQRGGLCLSSTIDQSDARRPLVSDHGTDNCTKRAVTLPKCLKTNKIPRKFIRTRPLSEEELDRKRVVANVQERRRMQRLNTALEKLKFAIPKYLHLQYRRLSKIKTLKLAIHYIGQLDRALRNSIDYPTSTMPTVALPTIADSGLSRIDGMELEQFSATRDDDVTGDLVVSGCEFVPRPPQADQSCASYFPTERSIGDGNGHYVAI